MTLVRVRSRAAIDTAYTYKRTKINLPVKNTVVFKCAHTLNLPFNNSVPITHTQMILHTHFVLFFEIKKKCLKNILLYLTTDIRPDFQPPHINIVFHKS